MRAAEEEQVTELLRLTIEVADKVAKGEVVQHPGAKGGLHSKRLPCLPLC